MKKLSKLIITQMEIRQTLCHICAYEEDGKIMELRFEPVGGKSSLGNIYVGQIENIAANIGAAFVQISAGERCYLQLSDASNAIYTSVRKGDRPLKPGDEILVQISRDAMKGKLPAVTTNLNFTGKYLVLTTGDKSLDYPPNFPMMRGAVSVSGWKRRFPGRTRNLGLSSAQMRRMLPGRRF